MRQGRGPPDEPDMIVRRVGSMAAFGVQVGGVDVEADIPAGAVPADRGEQDLGTRRHHRLSSIRIEVGDRAEQPSQPTGLVVDSNSADGRQGHRARMAIPDSDQQSAALASLVAESEAVPTTPLSFPPREPNPPASRMTALGLGVGGQGPTQIDRGLLEHLSGDLLPPSEAGHLLGDAAVGSGDKDTSGGLTALPDVERLDQVEPRPRDLDLRFCSLAGKGIGDQAKALVVGEPGRPGVSGEHRRLRRGGSECEPERRVPHSKQDRSWGMRHLRPYCRLRRARL
jgi:hypothetical protein